MSMIKTLNSVLARREAETSVQTSVPTTHRKNLFPDVHTKDQGSAAADDAAQTFCPGGHATEQQRDISRRAVIHQRMHGAAGEQRPVLFAVRSSENHAAGTF